jgi:hypothetical protein
MRRAITELLVDSIWRMLVESRCISRFVPLGIILLSVLALITIPAAAQTSAPSTSAAKVIAPGLESTARYAEKLDVPKEGKPNFSAGKLTVEAEISHWTTINGSREFTVPSQDFYIATLDNGTAVTVINGEEKLRHAGDMWAVQQGQSMTVRIGERRQENVTLDIFSVRPSH